MSLSNENSEIKESKSSKDELEFSTRTIHTKHEWDKSNLTDVVSPISLSTTFELSTPDEKTVSKLTPIFRNYFLL